LKFKLVALNLLLVLALGAIVWQARVRWNEAQAKRRNNLSVKVTPLPAPPLTPTPKPDAAPATKYADVATKNLFSKDRNPTVVIDPPKVEIAKPMPALQIVYGVLGLPSGTKAIMADKAGASGRSVHAGDMIGDFKIASLNPQDVIFEWEGKQIPRKIEDLIDRSSVPAPGGQPGPVQSSGPPRPVVNGGQPIPVGPGPGNSCVPGDNSPSGTVVGGFKKSFAQSPFGPIGCTWVPVQ
jgi:hypothetical protein